MKCVEYKHTLNITWLQEYEYESIDNESAFLETASSNHYLDALHYE